jgi:hypothetical protein
MKNWRKTVEVLPKKFKLFLSFCEKLELFAVKKSENLIAVSCPNLLKYRDEYTRKKVKNSGQTPDNVAPETETETETELDTDKDKRKKEKRKKSPPDETPPAKVEKKRGGKRFAPPPLDEISEYCILKGLKTDPALFRDHYEANGWMVGKSKMKDWKAAARNWSRREKSDSGGRVYIPPGSSPREQKNIAAAQKFLEMSPEVGAFDAFPTAINGGKGK